MFSEKLLKPKKALSVALVSLIASTHAAAAAKLDPELEKLFGPAPKKFSSTFVAGARKLKTAIEKHDAGALSRLSKSGLWQDYALWELGKLHEQGHKYREARASLLKLLGDYPASPLESRANEQLPVLELQIANANKGVEAQTFYRRAFSRISKKRWVEHERDLKRWFSLTEKGEPQAFDAFRAELLDALPNDSAFRKELVKSLGSSAAAKLQKLPRTRSSLGNSSIKAIFPDQALVDEAMALVLQGSWQAALEKFQAFPAQFPDSEQLDRALYWEAQCLAELGKDDKSKEKFQELWERYPLGYYGLQASLRLKKNISDVFLSAKPQLLPVEGPFVSQQWRALQRIRALLTVGATELAHIEAEYLFSQKPAGTTMGQDSAEESLALAKIYFATTYYLGAFTQFHSAFLNSKNILHADFLRLVYPTVFSTPIENAAKQYDIDPIVVYSLTKQESAFLPKVISRSDALGLMQIIIPTAKEMDANSSRELLFWPDYNTRLGAGYLRKLIDKFNGNLALALAGYNAGPHRASQWQKKLLETSPVMQKNFRTDIFIDTIPFTETRRYVASILRNIAWYKALASQPIPATVEEMALQWRAPSEETK